MSLMKLSASALAISALTVTAAAARDQVQITGSSTVLPYAQIVAENFGGQVLDTLGIGDAPCAHMGDDVPDQPLFLRVGLALAPGDAHAKAKAAAHWVSQARGGDGAIREAVDFILACQGKD